MGVVSIFSFFLSFSFQFPPLETRWELEPKCFPPATDFGIVTGDAPVSFSLSLLAVPEVFLKVNSAQSRSCL